MSPSATIVTVVVALVFFAWLFQSDTKDPGYEAWIKRQQEERKSDQAQKASMGIAVTDPGVTKDNQPRQRRDPNAPLSGAGRDDDQVIPDEGSGLASLDPDVGAPTTRPLQSNGRPGFGNGIRLDGTFIGPADPVLTVADSDLPTIVFRRDGTFHTQNMATAEIDMESGNSGLLSSLDRGAGRYRLAVNTLELNYTDGLTRKKGNRRVYTVVPVEGPENAPTAMVIQGKVFKLKTVK